MAQSKTPVIKRTSIKKETSSADFVCHVLTSCGKNATNNAIQESSNRKQENSAIKKAMEKAIQTRTKQVKPKNKTNKNWQVKAMKINKISKRISQIDKRLEEIKIKVREVKKEVKRIESYSKISSGRSGRIKISDIRGIAAKGGALNAQEMGALLESGGISSIKGVGGNEKTEGNNNPKTRKKGRKLSVSRRGSRKGNIATRRD